MKHRMVQYGLWPSCNNSCAFCLRKNREVWNKQQMLEAIDMTSKNIDYVDWENEFSDGISILGGEIYFITDKELQDAYMQLIDKIIDKILLVSKSEHCKYSTVTNGMYNPSFLYRVIDRIQERTGSMQFVDVNFSYDPKYRYPSEEKRLLALQNARDFAERYNYRPGIQTILTQYIIEDILYNGYDFNKFLNEDIKGCNFCFLYPHPISTGKKLDDFFFKREDFIKFCVYIKSTFSEIWYNMYRSTHNSGIYKYTGLIDKTYECIKQQPVLSDGKEELTECGHSVLYRCYSDSDQCMLCDLEAIGEE